VLLNCLNRIRQLFRPLEPSFEPCSTQDVCDVAPISSILAYNLACVRVYIGEDTKSVYVSQHLVQLQLTCGNDRKFSNFT
jgi:hypothetical protein